MRHKLITNLKTRFRNKRQLFLIEFENREFVFLATNNIKQNTGLEVYEFELLIGSTLRIDFYQKDEQMLNSKICYKDNLIVKEYFFELKKPIEKLRIENRDQLLPFKKIKDIFYFLKFNRENVGIKTEDGNVIFIPLKRFDVQSKLSKDERHILIGSYIYPIYYKKGESFFDGTIVQNGNVLRWLNLRYSNTVEAMHENFENSIGYYDGNSYHDNFNDGPRSWGYNSWDEMALDTAYEGDPSNLWNTD